MRFCLPALAVLAVFPALAQISGSAGSPVYSSANIVNGATQTPMALAPNTLVTIYGTNLAFSTRAVAGSDVAGNAMPTELDGVQVWFNAQPCPLFYISPTQINFLIPYYVGSGPASIIVANNGHAGLPADIQMHDTSPGLFLWGENQPVAVHLNGELISDSSPALPGEIIVLFAAGLGHTIPDLPYGQLATGGFPIRLAPQLQVLLDGVACPPGNILYAGLTFGFSGLYQINLRLPSDAPSNPEIQLNIGEDSSPGSIRLAIQPVLPGASRNAPPAGRVQ
jgi:uncharacterized protein (TIGR03437 family)